MRESWLRWDREAFYAERTLDVLVPEVPEVNLLPVAWMKRSEIRDCERPRIALRFIRATARRMTSG